MTAATTSDRILVLTVTGAIAAASTTFTCTTGDGALAVNPAAGAVAFTVVTTTDTTSATADSSYTTRAATAIGWGSATSYNQLTEAIAPTKHRFIFTPSASGVLNAGTAGAQDLSDTITITASSAIFVTGKVPVCTVVTGGGAATAATTSDSTLVLTVTTAFAASTEQTIECAAGDGYILAGTAAATITFGIVTTQDTTALNAQTGFVLRAATAVTFTSAATSNQLVVGLAPTKLKFVINPTTALATGTAGVNEVSDTITITADKAIYTTSKVPTCASTAGTVTAATTSDRILVLTVTGAIAAASTTFTCTTGDGALAVNPAAGAVAFTVVTTTDTTSATAASSYATRAASAATFTSAATSNELVQGLTPTNIKFTFTVLELNPTGTGAADIADTITITTTSADAVFVDNKIPACTGNNGGTVTALTSGGAGKTLTLTVTAQIAAGAHTFTCTNGGVGAIAANPTTPAITFTMVTTQDTTTSGVATYTTRAASAATFTSAATSNELVQGLTPTNIKFTFTVLEA